jgi:hypothetical protein
MQSGAMGTLRPIHLGCADRNWSDLCRLWEIEKRGENEKIELLRRVPPAALLTSVASLGWDTYPLVIDGETLKSTTVGAEGEMATKYSQRDQQPTTGSLSPPIDILIGDTDSEVSSQQHFNR